MATRSRKDRGIRSQLVVANWFKAHGFAYAESTGSGRSGVDVTGVLPLAIEVKARTGFSPLAWIKQAKGANRGTALPCVIIRCNGQGELAIGDWPVLLTLEDFTQLLDEAGYLPKENHG